MDTLPQTTGRRRRARRVEEDDAPAVETGRPEMRPEMRLEDSRAAAQRRAAEILGHIGDLDEGTDEFYIPRDMIPDGWDYEWKRRTVQGQEDPAYQVALARTGWTPVPVKRHPELMPANWTGMTIERKGQVLMERPKEISDRVRQLDDRRARNQVRAKEQQLAAAPPGTMEKEFSDPRTRPQIKKSYEAMPIPKDE